MKREQKSCNTFLLVKHLFFINFTMERHNYAPKNHIMRYEIHNAKKEVYGLSRTCGLLIIQ